MCLQPLSHLSVVACGIASEFIKLPFVFDVLGEADLVADVDYPSVVERRFAVELAEYLVLIRRQYHGVHLVRSVDHREKLKVEPSLVVRYPPGLEVIELPCRERYIELHVVDLMRLAVEKYDVFRRDGSAEAVAQIQSERRSVDGCRQARPVPNVFIRPHAPAPIEPARRAVRKRILVVAQSDRAAARKAVDLGVVIEASSLFERRRHGDIVPVVSAELYLAAQILFVDVVLIFAGQPSRAAVVDERHFDSALVEAHIAVRAVGRESELAAWHEADLALCYKAVPLEVEHRHRCERHVRIVRYRERDHALVVAEIVVVPFLDAQPLAADRGASVGLDLRKRVTALNKRALAVEQLARKKHTARDAVVALHALTLGELRSLTRLFETVLFALLHARIAGKEARLFERGTVRRVDVAKRARDAVAYSARLTRRAAAANVDDHVVLAGGLRFRERLIDYEPERIEREIILERTLIDRYRARAAGQDADARNRFFTSARAPILDLLFSGSFCCHVRLPLFYF